MYKKRAEQFYTIHCLVFHADVKFFSSFFHRFIFSPRNSETWKTEKKRKEKERKKERSREHAHVNPRQRNEVWLVLC